MCPGGNTEDVACTVQVGAVVAGGTLSMSSVGFSLWAKTERSGRWRAVVGVGQLSRPRMIFFASGGSVSQIDCY